MNRLFVYYGATNKYSLVAKKIALIKGIIIYDIIGYIARIFKRITKDELFSYGLRYYSVASDFPIYGIYNGYSDTDSLYSYNIGFKELSTPLMIKNTLSKLFEPEIYIDTRVCAQYMCIYCICHVDMNGEDIIDVCHMIKDEDEDLEYTEEREGHSFGYYIMGGPSNEIAYTLLKGLSIDDYIELGEKLTMRLNEIIKKRNLKMKVISFPMLHLSSSND